MRVIPSHTTDIATEDEALANAPCIVEVTVESVSPWRWTTADGNFAETLDLVPDGEGDWEEVGCMASLYHTVTLRIEDVWYDELGIGNPTTITVNVGGHAFFEEPPTERDVVATPDPYATPADGGLWMVMEESDEYLWASKFRPGMHAVVILSPPRAMSHPDCDFYPFAPPPSLRPTWPYIVGPGGEITCPFYEQYGYPYSRTLQELRSKVERLKGGA